MWHGSSQPSHVTLIPAAQEVVLPILVLADRISERSRSKDGVVRQPTHVQMSEYDQLALRFESVLVHH